MWFHRVDTVDLFLHLFYFLGILAIDASAGSCCHVGSNLSSEFFGDACLRSCKFAMVEHIDDFLFALVVDDSPVVSHSLDKISNDDHLQ